MLFPLSAASLLLITIFYGFLQVTNLPPQKVTGKVIASATELFPAEDTPSADSIPRDRQGGGTRWTQMNGGQLSG